MKSQGVLRKVIQAGNAKQIAADLGSSKSIIYKWTEEGESGRRNPLDLIVALYHGTGDRRPVEWLCRQANGSFVENATPRPPAPATWAWDWAPSPQLLFYAATFHPEDFPNPLA
jgi:hypothetical protein